MTAAFFAPGAVKFLVELEAHNTKAFFDSHREDYRREILGPLQELVAIAEPTYGPGRVMRQHRDLRFSRDKTPYRTTASMTAGTLGGIYLQLSTDAIDIGGGLYEPSREQLDRGRQAIVETPGAAAELTKVLDDLTERGYRIEGDPVKTAPRGYSSDHPHIGLLRLRHYAALARLPVDAGLDEIQRSWSQTRPLLDWIQTHIGT